MPDPAVESKESYRDAFGSFLVHVSKFGPWWYGITLHESDSNSLSKLCGMTTAELIILLSKCGLTGRQKKNASLPKLRHVTRTSCKIFAAATPSINQTATTSIPIPPTGGLIGATTDAEAKFLHYAVVRDAKKPEER
jgi:hypothetical protein